MVCVDLFCILTSTYVLSLQFRLAYKEETAHDGSIWTCDWGKLKPKPVEPESTSETPAGEPQTPLMPEQDIIVTGGLDDVVKVWNFDDNELKLKHTLTGHSLGIVSVAISSDGQSEWSTEFDLRETALIRASLPAIASSSLDSSLRFWRTESGQLLNQVALGPVDLWTVTFSPCDKYVASGSQDGKITLYSVETGKEDRVLDPQNGKFTLSIAYVGDPTKWIE